MLNVITEMQNNLDSKKKIMFEYNISNSNERSDNDKCR